MAGKIEKLTPEQEAELPHFRQRYLDMASSSGRIDRAKLEAAIADAYAVIGKPAPNLFIFDSPAACMLALKIFSMGDQPIGEISLRGQLGDQLGDQLGGQLRDQLGDQLGDQLWGQLRGQLGDQRLWNPNFLWGSQDLYWIAWARFAQHIGAKLEAETDKRLGIMERIAEQCEWWWPHEGIVVASEKPLSVRFDDQRRLHCEDAAAVQYSDGYALYAWHGTRLPERWVLERSTIDPAEILREENVETRAAGAACIGWPRMLSELNYKIIDAEQNPEHGELIELTLPGLPQPGRFLKAECPRNGTIVEGVPNGIKTVIAAQAWRVGLEPHEFSYPEIRT
jgi:hypothetical protein